MCTLFRKLSCEACYNISDAGLQCLTACVHLSDLTISYCNQVGTHVMNWSACLKKKIWPFYIYVTVGDGCWFDVCGWPGRVGEGYCKSLRRDIWQRYSKKCVHCVQHITNCIEMALRKNWHYACICGHHMLPKFATVFLLLLSSSVMLEKVYWRLWVSITDTWLCWPSSLSHASSPPQLAMTVGVWNASYTLGSSLWRHVWCYEAKT